MSDLSDLSDRSDGSDLSVDVVSPCFHGDVDSVLRSAELRFRRYRSATNVPPPCHGGVSRRRMDRVRAASSFAESYGMTSPVADIFLFFYFLFFTSTLEPAGMFPDRPPLPCGTYQVFSGIRQQVRGGRCAVLREYGQCACDRKLSSDDASRR